MTERTKMLSGELYLGSDPELVELRNQARRFMQAYNQTLYDDDPQRRELLEGILGSVGRNVNIQTPFFVDYGIHTHLGDQVFMNFNCHILDCAEVRIGDHTMLATAVQLLTATHPLLAADRVRGPESARPITIGRNCWLGGGVVVCPGVTIGDNTTIGAGAVVTKDIPANVLAAGNPCRVIRAL